MFKHKNNNDFVFKITNYFLKNLRKKKAFIEKKEAYTEKKEKLAEKKICEKIKSLYRKKRVFCEKKD